MQLLYSRFINVCGLPGRNIAADLYMEHLNAVAKGCIKNLGVNKTETAIVRSAKALGTIVPILENFDSQSNVLGKGRPPLGGKSSVPIKIVNCAPPGPGPSTRPSS